MIFTFIPEPTNDRDFSFQQRVIARGVSLLSDGYKVNAFITAGGCYFVHSPEGVCYIVDTNLNECGCECCKKNKFCKHLVCCALIEEEKREEAQVAELEEYARRNGLTD